jgi:SAM-dependent methyltransferase
VQTIARDFYADGLPVPSGSFDLALCTEVIEHLPSTPKPLLDEIRRVLRPGGCLLLTTPNAGGVNARLTALSAALKGRTLRPDIQSFYEQGQGFRGHHREYTVSEVQYMLSESGFVDLRCETVDYGQKRRRGIGPRSAARNLVSAAWHRVASDPNDFIVAVTQSP